MKTLIASVFQIKTLIVSVFQVKTIIASAFQMKTRIASAFLNVSVCLARRQSSLLRSLMECRSSLLWSFYDFHAEGFA